MGAGPNFLTIPDEQTFGGRVVEINMYLTLVSGKTDQTEGLKYLDQMLDKVLPQCLDLGWEFSVEPPFIDTFDDKAYVACNIAVSNTFELED